MYQKNVLRMKRDVQSERIESGYGDGSSTSFTYDSVSRLLQVYDSNSGLIQMTYDDLDRLTQELTPQDTVSYSYDAIGRRTSMIVNGLTPVTYQYDTASRLTQVAQGPQAVNLGYDAAGRRMSLTYPNGTGTNYFYDTASRLSEIRHQGPSGIIEDLLYTYDSAGNRIDFTRNNPQADLPQAVVAAYNAANQMTHFNTDTLTYDANGNLTFDGTTNYTWDARNRLSQMSNANVLASFSYDALGRRVSKTINGVGTEYLYDGNDIVAEIQNNTAKATYLRGLNIDEPFLRSSAIAEYYHTDALGSVLVLTDQNGAVQTIYNYEPFGNTAIGGTTTNSFQYTGRENDGTGLYYYRARYYSPTLQRFVSEDPALEEGGINLYLYARNNPVIYFDPTGLTTWPGSGPVTSPFGPRDGGLHNGVDIANGLGTPVVASDSGIVSPNGTGFHAGPHGENQIVINNDGDGTSGYAHVTLTVVPGQHVNEGDVIGFTDNSGNARGNGHVHYTFKSCQGCNDYENPVEHHLPKNNNYPKYNGPTFGRK
ncbi:MAG: peptidoglycan DD-metalloendopeptidase family protein [Nitrospirae bacterium]|nr:peptidoglycan DD-metalloendopeptidase family protein [Nitrospirota bacterium]